MTLFGTKGYTTVIDNLIAQMEEQAGKGKLSLADDLRYQHLKRHQQALVGLWHFDRRSSLGWQNLILEIQSLAAALAQVGAAEGAKDRGNRQHGVPVH